MRVCKKQELLATITPQRDTRELIRRVSPDGAFYRQYFMLIRIKDRPDVIKTDRIYRSAPHFRTACYADGVLLHDRYLRKTRSCHIERARHILSMPPYAAPLTYTDKACIQIRRAAQTGGRAPHAPNRGLLIFYFLPRTARRRSPIAAFCTSRRIRKTACRRPFRRRDRTRRPRKSPAARRLP